MYRYHLLSSKYEYKVPVYNSSTGSSWQSVRLEASVYEIFIYDALCNFSWFLITERQRWIPGSKKGRWVVYKTPSLDINYETFPVFTKN